MKTLNPAKWIKFNSYDDGRNDYEKYGLPCPYFRQEFTLTDKKAVKAELHATAVGVFKAYINGKETDNDYMSPGYTDYRIRIPTMRYDVLPLLQKDNAIVIVAGDGWAVGHMGNRMYRKNYYREICVCAKLTVEYEDGSKQIICTDENWRSDTDEIVRTDNYMGEFIDHNRAKDKSFYLPHYNYAQGNWRAPVVCDGDLSDTLMACACEEVAPRIKVKHVLTPEVLRKDERTVMYDMKQNMVGVIRLKVKGDKNTRIRARFGEMLEKDGTLYTENLRSAEATDLFYLNGEGVEEFRPLFTFHGFRYVELRITGNAEILSVTGEVMYTDLEKTGEWNCSDELVNRVYQNIVWGQRGNFLSVPTDCPQRDERLGWTGDAQIFCGTAMYNMDCDKFYRKYIQDLIDSQRGDGAIGSVVPHVPHCMYDGVECQLMISAGWGDAMTVIPYEHYLMYGDKKFLRDTIYFIKKFVRAEEKQTDDLIRPEENNYGDWLSVNSYTDKSLLSTEYFAFSTLLTARMCDIVGDEEARDFYDLHNRIKKAFRQKFLNADGKLSCHTQTSYLLAYASEMMSKEEIREPFMDTIRAADEKLTTGFLGIKFLLPTLCDLGESDIAYKMLTSREYPGWTYSAANGATTMWERWNSYTKEFGFGDVSMNSFNHYSFGSCGEWMYKYCLGIVPMLNGAGFEKLTLRPYPDKTGKLTSASGSYVSRMGKITAGWQNDNGKMVYTASVPKEIELTLDIPEGVTAKIERY